MLSSIIYGARRWIRTTTNPVGVALHLSYPRKTLVCGQGLKPRRGSCPEQMIYKVTLHVPCHRIFYWYIYASLANVNRLCALFSNFFGVVPDTANGIAFLHDLIDLAVHSLCPAHDARAERVTTLWTHATASFADRSRPREKLSNSLKLIGGLCKYTIHCRYPSPAA